VDDVSMIVRSITKRLMTFRDGSPCAPHSFFLSLLFGPLSGNARCRRGGLLLRDGLRAAAAAREGSPRLFAHLLDFLFTSIAMAT